MIQQSENVYKIHPMQNASCFTVAFLLNSNVHDRTRTWNHAEQIFGASDSMRFMKIFHTVSIACVDDVLKVSLDGAHLQANKMHVNTAILVQAPMAPATRINGIATVCLQKEIMPLHHIVTSCSQC
jgi:hypothetical protein